MLLLLFFIWGFIPNLNKMIKLNVNKNPFLRDFYHHLDVFFLSNFI